MTNSPNPSDFDSSDEPNCLPLYYVRAVDFQHLLYVVLHILNRLFAFSKHNQNNDAIRLSKSEICKHEQIRKIVPEKLGAAFVQFGTIECVNLLRKHV